MTSIKKTQQGDVDKTLEHNNKALMNINKT